MEVQVHVQEKLLKTTLKLSKRGREINDTHY